MYDNLNKIDTGNAIAEAVFAQNILGIESGPELRQCFV